MQSFAVPMVAPCGVDPKKRGIMGMGEEESTHGGANMEWLCPKGKGSRVGRQNGSTMPTVADRGGRVLDGYPPRIPGKMAGLRKCRGVPVIGRGGARHHGSGGLSVLPCLRLHPIKGMQGLKVVEKTRDH